jgi:hypothetical protein
VERCRHAYEDEGLVVAELAVVVSVAAVAIQRHRSIEDRQRAGTNEKGYAVCTS